MIKDNLLTRQRMQAILEDVGSALHIAQRLNLNLFRKREKEVQNTSASLDMHLMSQGSKIRTTIKVNGTKSNF